MAGESQGVSTRILQDIYNLFGEFRLNLITNCLSESQFPHFQNEITGKEFPKYQIQGQQYCFACCMVQIRKINYKDFAS